MAPYGALEFAQFQSFFALSLYSRAIGRSFSPSQYQNCGGKKRGKEGKQVEKESEEIPWPLIK